MELLATETMKLMDLPNVMGVGYGYKEVRGVCTDEPAVTVLVRKKVTVQALSPKHTIPRQLASVPTDVIEVGDIVTLTGQHAGMRPARPGVSIGHKNISAGTMGAVGYDVEDGTPLILSNNHVLANATDGKDGRAQIGDAILQPGRYDGGTMDDILGHLQRYVPLHRIAARPNCAIAAGLERIANRLIKRLRADYEFRVIKHSEIHNQVDAAVAKPVEEGSISPDILDIGIPEQPIEAQLGMWVQKSGRTSGWTEARIKVIDAVLRVAVGDTGFAIFTDQIVTTPLGQPGDSGSLVLTEGRRPVGLLAAGSQQVTICNMIQPVLSLLHIALTSGES